MKNKKGYRWSYNPLQYIWWCYLYLKYRKNKWKNYYIKQPIVITNIDDYLNYITKTSDAKFRLLEEIGIEASE